MSTPSRTVVCPVCKRGGRRVTKAGTIWRHQPYSKKFSGTMVTDCKGSGMLAPVKRAPLQQQAVPS